MKNKQGIAVVVLAYILFAYLYVLTIIYGIWRFKFSQHVDQYINVNHAIINTGFFSAFYVMMLWAHIAVVYTNPGEMPRDYEKLQEAELPEQFYELIKERESIYHELIVKKKVRKGELSLEANDENGLEITPSLVTVGSLNNEPE